MQTYTCSWSWHVRGSSSHLCVSCLASGCQGFVLSYKIHFWVYLESTCGGTDRPGKPKPQQSHSPPLVNSENSTNSEETMWSEFSAREPINVSRLTTFDQECWFVTRLIIIIKKLFKKTGGFKTWLPAFGLGRVINIQMKLYAVLLDWCSWWWCFL